MKIAGIGDNVIDRYMNMGIMFPGGNAVNVAAHAALLGAELAYVEASEQTEKEKY